MSIGDEFALISEAVESLMVADFETRRVLAVNDSLIKLFGSSSNELVNSQLDSIITIPGKGVDFNSFFETVQKRGLAKLDRVILKSQKHTCTYLEICASMQYSENDKMVRIWVRDVSEREKAVLEYQKNEMLMKRAQKVGRFGHLERNLQNGNEIWSDEVYDIFGLDPKKNPPGLKSLSKVIDQQDIEKLASAIRLAAKTQKVIEVQFRVNRPNGEQRVIHGCGRMFRDEHSSNRNLVGTIHDITERVRHKEMQERKARLRLVKDIAMEITSDMSIEEVVRNSLKRISEMFPEYRVAFGTILEENHYRCIASKQPSGMQCLEGMEIDFSPAVNFVETLLESPVAINDVKEDDIIRPLRDIFLSVQVEAMLSMSVKHVDGLRGILCLHARFRHIWTEHEIATLAEVSRYLAVAVKNAQLAEEQKKTAASLKEALEKLQAESEELTHKNIALNQILEHLENEKKNYKEQISESVESLLMPIVKKLKLRGGNLGPKDIALLENSLNSIVGKEINVFRKNLTKLSPRELDICELIRERKSSKEISSVLNLSTLTIHKHR